MGDIIFYTISQYSVFCCPDCEYDPEVHSNPKKDMFVSYVITV